MNPPTVTIAPDEPAQVRARLDALGLDGIFDVHTHFLPARMLDKVWGYFDAVGPLTGQPWPIAYRRSEEERLRVLRDLDVRHFSALTYPHKPGMAAWLNQWGAEFAADKPDCLQSATFYPEPGAGDYVREAVDAGARIFKAHVQVGDYDPNSPLLDPVWEVLSQSGTPLVIHSGHGPAPGRFTGPGGMEALLGRYPDLVLIVAHMGLPDYSRFLDLVEKYDGVHLDTTMAFTAFTEASTPFPAEELPRLKALGERVLFGSDFPNIPYPYLEAVDGVLGLGLGDEWTRGVLYENAARLFGLPPAG
ncbi:amidohydrolase family protein [Nocardioides sp. NPDC087217]|uniref:amidohydrolase family protein n=1 Tax=Nocardioides sp. NPDC087217 TaxID=3364335 RepID=UPI0037F16E44